MIAKLVDGAGKNGELKPATLALKLEEEPKGRFLYPGKLKAVPGATPQWVLADSGHNQIVLLDDKGADVKRFGSGTASLKDGDASAAAFNHPQGLIASDDAIFVADTGNHAIRRIDLKSGAVTTLAGDGSSAARICRSRRSPARRRRSPHRGIWKRKATKYTLPTPARIKSACSISAKTRSHDWPAAARKNIPLTGSPSKAATFSPNPADSR